MGDTERLILCKGMDGGPTCALKEEKDKVVFFGIFSFFLISDTEQVDCDQRMECEAPVGYSELTKPLVTWHLYWIFH